MFSLYTLQIEYTCVMVTYSTTRRKLLHVGIYVDSGAFVFNVKA